MGLRQPRPAREVPRRHAGRPGLEEVPREVAPADGVAGEPHHEVRAVLRRAPEEDARSGQVTRSPPGRRSCSKRRAARRCRRITRCPRSSRAASTANARRAGAAAARGGAGQAADDAGEVVPVRAYRPVRGEDDVLPALVFFHGGGWTIGDLDTHDVLCRQLAHGARCAVFSVDYRLGAGKPVPGGGGGLPFAATKYVIENAESSEDRSGPHRRRRRQRGRQPRRGGGADRAEGDRIAFQLLIYPGDRPALARIPRTSATARATC